MYLPSSSNLRYIRGEYMLNMETKYGIVKSLGSDAAILYEYFYEKRRDSLFTPTNDKAIGDYLGWSASKVTRIKSLLKANNLLLILKDTIRDGTTFYRTILKPELIIYYNEHSALPTNIDIDIRDIPKPN